MYLGKTEKSIREKIEIFSTQQPDFKTAANSFSSVKSVYFPVFQTSLVSDSLLCDACRSVPSYLSTFILPTTLSLDSSYLGPLCHCLSINIFCLRTFSYILLPQLLLPQITRIAPLLPSDLHSNVSLSSHSHTTQLTLREHYVNLCYMFTLFIMSLSLESQAFL